VTVNNSNRFQSIPSTNKFNFDSIFCNKLGLSLHQLFYSFSRILTGQYPTVQFPPKKLTSLQWGHVNALRNY